MGSSNANVKLTDPGSRSSNQPRALRSLAIHACAVALALAGWLRLGYATTAVALYMKDFAVVAVDGRINKVGPLISGHQSGCKLYVADGKVAVLAGLTEEPDAGFDIRAIFHNVLNQQVPPAQAADLVQQRIEQALPAALQVFQKKDPAAFAARAQGEEQLLLVGTDASGEVQVSRRSVPYQQAHPAERDDSAGTPDHVGIALIGETTAIDLDLLRLKKTNGWEGMGNPADLEKLARRFIALEIVARPMQVGPPISMVLVDKDGIHWVDPGACHQ
jgi:hypothetical protein